MFFRARFMHTHTSSLSVRHLHRPGFLKILLGFSVDVHTSSPAPPCYPCFNFWVPCGWLKGPGHQLSPTVSPYHRVFLGFYYGGALRTSALQLGGKFRRPLYLPMPFHPHICPCGGPWVSPHPAKRGELGSKSPRNRCHCASLRSLQTPGPLR